MDVYLCACLDDRPIRPPSLSPPPSHSLCLHRVVMVDRGGWGGFRLRTRTSASARRSPVDAPRARRSAVQAKHRRQGGRCRGRGTRWTGGIDEPLERQRASNPDCCCFGGRGGDRGGEYFRCGRVVERLAAQGFRGTSAHQVGWYLVSVCCVSDACLWGPCGWGDTLHCMRCGAA